jgi:type IV pilus assembly protein PilY1
MRRETRSIVPLALIALALLWSSAQVFSAPGTLQQAPLSVGKELPPMTMLVMSNDHQLYTKAYTDYSDLNDDGTLDVTYTDGFEYGGYFDPNQCYEYSAVYKRFKSTGLTNSGSPSLIQHWCADKDWSGNFLNWATMTRIDIIRNVLYGGKRVIDGITLDGDGNTLTVLARSVIPRDVHAFVKVFTSATINKFTQYTTARNNTISICNVNHTSLSEEPQMRVAEGNQSAGLVGWPFWSASDGTQCTWNDDSSGETGQDSRPLRASQDQDKEFNVLVEVCSDTNSSLDSRCRQYGGNTGNYKPAGVLQKFGEDGDLRFGLITGTYNGNKSGGALRSQMKPIIGNLILKNEDDDTDTAETLQPDELRNEIDPVNGTFNHLLVENGIIETIDAFTISEYDYDNSVYSDCNTPGISSFANGECSNWGNPISEMYLEALRYLSGAQSGAQLTPTPAFNADDSTLFSELTQIAAWDDPYSNPSLACASCNIVVISTGLNSFDTDEISTSADDTSLVGDIKDDVGTLTSAVLDGYLDTTITANEGISGNYFVGQSTDTNGDNRCTAKAVAKLSAVKGSCPEVPSQEGGYDIAGLAYHANTHDLRNNSVTPGDQTVNTYAISLAESLPSFKIPVNGKFVSFAPSCESRRGSSSAKTITDTSTDWYTCSLINVTVLPSSTTSQTGSFILSWEDSSWGNDYDMDAIVALNYCVGTKCTPNIGADQILITTSEIIADAGFTIRFGYTITGVRNDGVHFGLIWKHEGDEGFSSLDDDDRDLFTYPVVQNVTNPSGLASWVQGYTADASLAAKLLENPLWYAAKYGNFNDFDGDGIPTTDYTDINNNPEWDAVDLNGLPNPDGIPDSYFPVSNPSQLTRAFNTILGDITSGGSASGAPFSSGRISNDTLLFLSKFNTESWSGTLEAFKLNDDGIVDADTDTTATIDPVWSAAAKLNATIANDYSTRKIFTYNPAATGAQGVVFKAPVNLTSLAADEISQTQVTDLRSGNFEGGTAYLTGIIDYIKGDKSNEVRNAGTYRFRNRLDEFDQPFTLGALVHSTPEYMGKPSELYPNDIAGAGNPYSAFILANDELGERIPVVFVGANDGMLHAFDASVMVTTDNDTLPPTTTVTSRPESGNELFAYIPSFLSDRSNGGNGLANLADLNYQYKAYVDGPVSVRDVFVTKNGGTTAAWRSYLVGATRTGGNGLYILDVSNPDAMDVADVIGEFTHPDLGATFSKPEIAKMNNDRWAAIFGNGYNNTGSGEAKLFILYLDADFSDGLTEGTEYKILTTRRVFGSDDAVNGLSSPTIADLDGDFVVDRIYAGDVQGNMWAFNVSDVDHDSWGSAYGTTAAPLPLFSGCFPITCDASSRQAITTSPQIQLHPSRRSSTTSPNVLVYFGTGQFIAAGDDTDETLQSFYAVWDTDDGVVVAGDAGVNGDLDRGDLNEQVFGYNTSTSLFTITADKVTYSATEDDTAGGFGWYVDLNGANTAEKFTGGRVVINPLLLGEIIFFSVTSPEVEEFSCKPAGNSYLVGLDSLNGSRASFSVFNTTEDGVPDSTQPVLEVEGSLVGIDGILDSKGGTNISGSRADGSYTQDNVGVSTPIPPGRKSRSIIR